MKDYLYYQFYLEEFKNLTDEEEVDDTFLIPLLYITKIYENNEEIEDWKDQTLLNKLNFLKKIPNEIIFNIQKNNSSNDFLLSFIKTNFDEEKINTFTENFEVTCPTCNEKYNRSLFI